MSYVNDRYFVKTKLYFERWISTRYICAKDDAKPDLKIEYLRDYFSKGVRDEAEKDLCQEKMIEMCETLFDSNEIEEYCLQKGCVKNELCYFFVAKMAKLYNIDMLSRMLDNANVFERKVSSALESYTEMKETEEKYEKIVKNAKVDLCEKGVITDYVSPEFVRSFKIIMKGFFRHLQEKIFIMKV